MQSDMQPAPISKGALWAGRIMSALPALFLLVDGVMKLVADHERLTGPVPARGRRNEISTASARVASASSRRSCCTDSLCARRRAIRCSI